MSRLAGVVYRESRFAEAERFDRETLDIRRRVLGPEHPQTVNSMNGLAGDLFREGRYAEAEKLYRETFDIERRVLGPEHPDTATVVYNLAVIAALRGDLTEALSLLRQALDHGLERNVALYMEKDTDFESLHGDPRFTALVAHAKQVAQSKDVAAQKQN
jgi:Flp pilus assembly protein TadD